MGWPPHWGGGICPPCISCSSNCCTTPYTSCPVCRSSSQCSRSLPSLELPLYAQRFGCHHSHLRLHCIRAASCQELFSSHFERTGSPLSTLCFFTQCFVTASSQFCLSAWGPLANPLKFFHVRTYSISKQSNENENQKDIRKTQIIVYHANILSLAREIQESKLEDLQPVHTKDPVQEKILNKAFFFLKSVSFRLLLQCLREGF